MRVTSSMLLRNVLADVQRVRERLAETQERASSGLRINRPSDDPVGFGAAGLLRSGLDELEQYARNIAKVRGRVGGADDALGRATDIMIRVKELAVQGANTTNEGVFDELAQVAQGLHGELVAQANAQIGGQHAFHGYDTDSAPFTVSGPFAPGTPAPTVTFAGSATESQVTVGEGLQVSVSFDGRAIFMGDGDGDGNPDAGREDLFDVVADLWVAFDTDDPAQVQAALDRVNRSLDQLSTARTRVGNQLGLLDREEVRNGDLQATFTAQLSRVQDADAAEVFSELVNQEAALQAALSTTARILQPTLLDFLA